MADSGILFPLILGVTMQQVLVITQARVPYGTRAWVITNLLHDVEDHHFQGLMY